MRRLIPFLIVMVAAGGSAGVTIQGAPRAAARPAAHPAEDPFGPAREIGNQLLHTLHTRAGIPGLSVAVSIGGRMVWSEALGQAQVELEVAATRGSRFRIASISKNLTGTAVARLVQEGRLDLEAPISTYLADLPEAWRTITTGQLASHTSGIGHYLSPEDALDVRHYTTTIEALEKFKDRPLLHVPDEKETYASFAYTVIAAVIEAITDRPFLEYMQQAIFAPLQMASTGPDDQRAIIPARTGFYELDADGAVINSPYQDLSGRWAGSGFLSTAEDMARFGAAHTKPGFLSAASLELLSTPRTLHDGSRTAEGLGWGPRQDWDGRSTLWGNGRTPGATCGLLVFPAQDLSIALLSNLRGAPIERGELQLLALPFLAIIEGQPLERLTVAELGGYSLIVVQGEASLDATLTLAGTPEALHGQMAISGSSPFPVVNGFRAGDSAWIVTLTPGNDFMPVRLVFAGQKVSGTLPRAGNLRFTGSRTAVP